MEVLLTITTWQCLACLGNTGGWHCDTCLPGYYGNPGDGYCKVRRLSLAPRIVTSPPCCSPASATCTAARVPSATPGPASVCARRNMSAEHADSVKVRPVQTFYIIYFQFFMLDGFGAIRAGCRQCGCNRVGSVGDLCDGDTGQCDCRC